ncbi:hypothetical protein [Spirosoma endophyticum]|uniref:hypothetical protein n=1 Tax=Spirosoma endophyticum TaxID=662367 RepID=UPI0015A542C3|nr:hypothetical protein [Spirosoma endophyticum]
MPKSSASLIRKGRPSKAVVSSQSHRQLHPSEYEQLRALAGHPLVVKPAGMP